jgi:hypothetical protein
MNARLVRFGEIEIEEERYTGGAVQRLRRQMYGRQVTGLIGPVPRSGIRTLRNPGRI